VVLCGRVTVIFIFLKMYPPMVLEMDGTEVKSTKEIQR
jgi:hypothetical protein